MQVKNSLTINQFMSYQYSRVVKIEDNLMRYKENKIIIKEIQLPTLTIPSETEKHTIATSYQLSTHNIKKKLQIFCKKLENTSS